MNVLRSERFAAALLLVAAVLGLVLANLPFGPAVVDLKDAHLELPWLGLDLSTGHWVSDGLLAIFFFIVAVELKRELVIGELNSLSKALLPAIAALGGVVVPAGIFLRFTAGTDTVDGWPIPTATDIAFALGVLAIFGTGIPTRVRVFLLALAVLDDLIAILIIAFFFTSDADLAALGFGRHRDPAVRRCQPRLMKPRSGWILARRPQWPIVVAAHGARRAHLVLRVPVRRARDDRGRRARPRDGAAPRRSRRARARAVLERHHPAAVRVHRSDGADPAGDAERADPAFWGILVGLPVGKIVGITLAGVARRTVRAPKPGDAAHDRRPPRRRALGGIGFTVSLLMNELAFAGIHEVVDEGTLAVLLGSGIAIVLSAVFVTIRSRQYRRRGAARGRGGAFAH